MSTLAIDFGTSNSAAAILENGRLRRLAIEAGEETLPTAVFFPLGGKMVIGRAAQAALIEGEEGRYMRALKSVLGTTLFHESRLVGGKRRTLAEVVTAFLVAVKARAEAEAGQQFTRALSGRPVHFHADPERDARALDDLAHCYAAAGFEDVTFMAEPEAAALAAVSRARPGTLGLVVDIGGGTSDFTVFRVAERPEVIASHGIRLGGTDFDRAVSLSHAMPRLGMGGELRREFGPGLLPIPAQIFEELATWAKIPFVYAPETKREVDKMVKLAVEPKRLGRLATVLEHELGHELAFEVEAGKIGANNTGSGRIDMGEIEPDLGVRVTTFTLAQALEAHRARLGEAMAETLRLAGVAPGEIASVILVGGSSLMGLVAEEARALMPEAEQLTHEAFTAIVDGLALATAS